MTVEQAGEGAGGRRQRTGGGAAALVHPAAADASGRGEVKGTRVRVVFARDFGGGRYFYR